MEANGAFSRHRKSSSSDRFISIFSQSPPLNTGASVGEELSEDDVFWSGDFAESSHRLDSPSTSSASPFQQHINAGKNFNRVENFGILAALPETGPDKINRSVFNHKASISPSSSSSFSSSRMIPILPRPPVERPVSMSFKYHQSAPVTVPMMLNSDRGRGRDGGFGYADDEELEDDEEGEMLPPHEIVARQAAKTPIISCSVLEGAGRTLKGRDLRQVPQQITAALAVVLIAVVSRMEPSACSVVKASVSCVDCGHDYDLSGIRVMIECDEEKKLGIATTNQNGSFEADLPLAGKGILVPASNCLARLLGGPGPLYALNENMVSKIIMAEDIIDTYTTSTPLSFIKSCCPVGKNGKYKSSDAELDSKTVDLPIPSEFGLPPTSYYTPIIPIIGIP